MHFCLLRDLSHPPVAAFPVSLSFPPSGDFPVSLTPNWFFEGVPWIFSPLSSLVLELDWREHFPKDVQALARKTSVIVRRVCMFIVSIRLIEGFM